MNKGVWKKLFLKANVSTSVVQIGWTIRSKINKQQTFYYAFYNNVYILFSIFVFPWKDLCIYKNISLLHLWKLQSCSHLKAFKDGCDGWLCSWPSQISWALVNPLCRSRGVQSLSGYWEKQEGWDGSQGPAPPSWALPSLPGPLSWVCGHVGSAWATSFPSIPGAAGLPQTRLEILTEE